MNVSERLENRHIQYYIDSFLKSFVVIGNSQCEVRERNP